MAGDSFSKLSDEKIAQIVCAGNVDIFEQLMVRYQPKLTRYALFLTGNEAAAQDIVQESFIKAFTNLRGFNPKRKFSSWVYRIAHNESMNYLAKKKSFSLDSQPEFANSIASQASYSKIEELVDKKLNREALWQCLLKLSVKYREPVVLYYLQGDSYQQISDSLRLPTSTVGVRLKRAKQQLLQICKTMGIKP